MASAIFIMIVNMAMANIKSLPQRNAKIVRGVAYGAATFAVFLGLSMVIQTTTSANYFFLINPAFTVGMAVAGGVKWAQVAPMIASQVLGMLVGQILVVLANYKKYQEVEDSTELLAMFVTINDFDNRTYENRPSAWINGFFTEFFASFIFFFILAFSINLQQSSIMLVIGFVAFVLVASTGAVMNPAMDFAARLIFWFMPDSILGDAKDDSRWWYSIVPIVVPFIAAIAAVALVKIILKTGTASTSSTTTAG
jgi:glycerol uptake facilitator protein